MSAKSSAEKTPSAEQKSLSVADRLERKLAEIRADQRKQLLNENIVRLEKNGDLSYETVRTVGVPVDREAFHSPDDPNFYTETPASSENGQQFDTAASASEAAVDPPAPAEVTASEPLTATGPVVELTADSVSAGGISIHHTPTAGQKNTDSEDESADPLEELLARALSRPKRGRPAAFDEHNKGKLVALLSLGMSLPQAAAVLGVSHGTIRNTLKADPALAEEITAARFQAQLQPLACVIREARRSWKAATWLLKYLDSKIASHEETPDERCDRQEREREEFLARATGRRTKTRQVLG